MKIRTGFISNSSTTSYVVAIPKGLTQEQIKGMLHLEGKIYDDTIERSAVGLYVLEDIMKKKPADLKTIMDALEGWLEGSPDSSEFVNSSGEVDWDAYNKADEVYRQEIAMNFMNLYSKDHHIYTFEYGSDVGNLSSYAEYFQVFNNFQRITISRH